MLAYYPLNEMGMIITDLAFRYAFDLWHFDHSAYIKIPRWEPIEYYGGAIFFQTRPNYQYMASIDD